MSPKLIEYDVTNVEEGGGGTGVKVKPGVVVAEIMRCVQRTQNRAGNPANDLEIALNVGAEYDWVFTYVGLSEAADWKLAELIRACKLPAKGKLNTDKIVGKIIRVKINTGDYNGEYSPDAGRLMPPQEGDEVGGKASEISSSGDDGPVDDTANGEGADSDYPDGFEPSRESDPEIGSYDDWPDGDPESEVEDRGLTLAGGRGDKRAKAIAALRADDEAHEGDGGTEDDTGTTDDADDYEEWDLEKLTSEWNDREMGDLPSVKGRNAESRMKVAMIEALRADDAENPFTG